jgi:hypothetical protein
MLVSLLRCFGEIVLRDRHKVVVFLSYLHLCFGKENG